MIVLRTGMTNSGVTQSGDEFYLALNVKAVALTDDQFFRLCHDNRDFRIEMTAEKELIIMSPTKPGTGRKNAKFLTRLGAWAERDGTGECFDGESEFTLPNGAKRAPDASWILKSRWYALPEKEREEQFTRICPDFVMEMRSRSDRISNLRKKMEEYIANGARLGWLLDPVANCAMVFRPGRSPDKIERPTLLKGDPLLVGFEFDFKEIL
jgi:Uma2 family endonuclease